jgi:hypothetical protein
MGKRELTKYRQLLLKAFRLNPIKIHHSTGLPMNEIIWHIQGLETENVTELTMHNLYETIESEISKTNSKLNLVQ